MKRRVLTVFLLMCAAPAMADRGDQYLIGRLGTMQIEQQNAKLAYAAGIYYGYGLWRDLSIEAEWDFTFAGGQYAGAIERGHYSVWTIATYAAYRVPLVANLFFKGKVGGIIENIKRNIDGQQEQNKRFDHPEVAGGIGMGYALREMTLEMEYTRLEKDIGFYGLGMHYQF